MIIDKCDHSPEHPLWMDRHQIWHSGLSCGLTHPLQLFWQSAEVFGISWDSVRVEFCFFPISGLSVNTLLVLLCSLWYMCLLLRPLLSVVSHC